MINLLLPLCSSSWDWEKVSEELLRKSSTYSEIHSFLPLALPTLQTGFFEQGMKMEKGATFYQKSHPSDKAHHVERPLGYVNSNEGGSDTFTSPAPLKLSVATCILFTYTETFSCYLRSHRLWVLQLVSASITSSSSTPFLQINRRLQRPFWVSELLPIAVIIWSLWPALVGRYAAEPGPDLSLSRSSRFQGFLSSALMQVFKKATRNSQMAVHTS